MGTEITSHAPFIQIEICISENQSGLEKTNLGAEQTDLFTYTYAFNFPMLMFLWPKESDRKQKHRHYSLRRRRCRRVCTYLYVCCMYGYKPLADRYLIL
jgi:hypothetical protein